MASTDYLVFREFDHAAHTWEIIKPYTAATADHAKGQAALEFGDGTYSAVPLRNWQPAAFTVQPRAVQVKA